MEMAICTACGCSSGQKRDYRRSVTDSVSAAEQGAAAESDRRENGLVSKSIGRALRRQRSRWLRLTGAQRLRRMLFWGMAPVMLAVIPLMMGASSETQF